MTEEIKNKHRFKPGNTFGKGRPVGAKNKAVYMLDHATEEDHEVVMRNIIDLAKSGDFGAMTLYSNKVCGVPRLPSTVNLSFAKRINSIADATEAMKDVSYGAMTGAVDMEDAEQMQKILDATMGAIQKNIIHELETFRERMAIQKNNK